MVEEAVIAAVMSVAKEVPEEHVRQVLTAYLTVQDGAPVGTLATDPATGAFACRVLEGGVPLWRVTALDGGTWADLQPRLAGWEILREGSVEPPATKQPVSRKTKTAAIKKDEATK